MNTLKKNCRLVLCLTIYLIFYAQNGIAQERLVYKTIDTLSLSMETHTPEQANRLEKYPVIVFFFGGGWVQRDIAQFRPHAA